MVHELLTSGWKPRQMPRVLSDLSGWPEASVALRMLTVSSHRRSSSPQSNVNAPSQMRRGRGRRAERGRLPEDARVVGDVVPGQEKEEAKGQRTLLESGVWRDSGCYLRRAFGDGEESSCKTSKEERRDRQPNPLVRCVELTLSGGLYLRVHEADHRESHAERETRHRSAETDRGDGRPDEKQNADDAEQDHAQSHPPGRDELPAEGPPEAAVEHERDERNGDERRQPR
jgi:hypothetical protein